MIRRFMLSFLKCVYPQVLQYTSFAAVDGEGINGRHAVVENACYV